MRAFTSQRISNARNRVCQLVVRATTQRRGRPCTRPTSGGSPFCRMCGGLDAPRSHRGVAVATRVAFIETTVNWATHPATGFQHDGVERAGQGPFIVQVGAA